MMTTSALKLISEMVNGMDMATQNGSYYCTSSGALVRAPLFSPANAGKPELMTLKVSPSNGLRCLSWEEATSQCQSPIGAPDQQEAPTDPAKAGQYRVIASRDDTNTTATPCFYHRHNTKTKV